MYIKTQNMIVCFSQSLFGVIDWLSKVMGCSKCKRSVFTLTEILKWFNNFDLTNSTEV